MTSNASMRVSRELQEIACEIEEKLAEVAGETVSFSLFVWTDGIGSYVSNSADRENIKNTLLTIIDSWDAGKPDIAAHELE